MTKNSVFRQVAPVINNKSTESSQPDKTVFFGVEVWTEGAFYHGNFENNVKHGYGIYRWPDGSCYQGHWAADEMNGFGSFRWQDGREYNGEFN